MKGILFDITDSGALLHIYFDRPEEAEITEMMSNKPVKMAFLSKENVIIMLVKLGNLNWMDAPYSPHLSKNMTHLPVPEKGMGLGVHLLLFDTYTGELKTQRLFSMGEKLTGDLVKEIAKLRLKPFDAQAYSRDIQSAYRFSTDDLVKQARMIYRVQ